MQQAETGLAEPLCRTAGVDKKSHSLLEMSDPASWPEIAAKRDNMQDYDTILCVSRSGGMLRRRRSMPSLRAIT